MQPVRPLGPWLAQNPLQGCMRTRPGSAFELERRWGPLPPTAEPPQSLARAPRPRHKAPADEPRVKTLLPLAQRLAEAKRRHASKPRQRPSAGSLKMLRCGGR